MRLQTALHKTDLIFWGEKGHLIIPFLKALSILHFPWVRKLILKWLLLTRFHQSLSMRYRFVTTTTKKKHDVFIKSKWQKPSWLGYGRGGTRGDLRRAMVLRPW